MQFDGSASTDPDGTITSYAWNFGDGATGTGSVIWHQYASVGSFAVTLTVTDNLGASTVPDAHDPGGNDQPAAHRQLPSCHPRRPSAPGRGSTRRASSDPDGSIVSYQWAFGDGSTATGNVVYHQFGSAGTFPSA